MGKKLPNSMLLYTGITYLENTLPIICLTYWKKMKMLIRGNLEHSLKMVYLQMTWKEYTPKLMRLTVKIPLEPKSPRKRLPRKDGLQNVLHTQKERLKLQRIRKSFLPRLKLKRNNSILCPIIMIANKCLQTTSK